VGMGIEELIKSRMIAVYQDNWLNAKSRENSEYRKKIQKA
jgi:hypothetical protein